MALLLRAMVVIVLASLPWLVGLAPSAGAMIELTVERVYPDKQALPKFGNVYLQIRYRSEVPVYMQARAFHGGQAVNGGLTMNAPALYPAGAGSGLVSFGFFEPALVDEIRVTVNDENWHELAQISVARTFTWSSEPAAKSPDLPAWLRSMIDESIRLQDARPQNRAAFGGPLALLYGLFVYISVPGYALLQVASFFRLRGGWLVAGLVPVPIVTFALCNALWAQSQGSNIWPLMFLYACQFGTIYLAALLLARWMLPGGHVRNGA